MFVRAVFAPERTDDAQLGEGRLALEHVDQPFVLFFRQPVLGDQRRCDRWIAGARGNSVLLLLSLHQADGPGGASGFLAGDSGTFIGAPAPCFASAAEIIRGELLVPL